MKCFLDCSFSMKITPILLAGGYGTRLSPLSVQTLPKQYIQMFNGKKSLLQITVKRIRSVFRNENIVIATNIIYSNIAKQQLSEINEINYSLLIEQQQKNTLPTIASVAKIYTNSDVLFFTPTDLIIDNINAFAREVITSCMYCYLNNKHVLFGIKPTRLDCNFGYIKITPTANKSTGADNIDYDDVFNVNSFKQIKCFIEKPAVEKAKTLHKSGQCYWNSGMFVFARNILINNINCFYPSLLDNTTIANNDENKNIKQEQLECLSTYIKTTKPKNMKNNTEYTFVYYGNNVPKISIDIAILNKITNDLRCIIANFDWLDFGNWKNFISLLFQSKLQIVR